MPDARGARSGAWILNTGAQRHMLPQCYPNYKTVHRRFQQWCEREVLREVLRSLANTRESVARSTSASALSTRRSQRPRGSATRSVRPGAARA